MSNKITAIQNSKLNAQEELFTELTSEEAAVVEGGANLELDYLYAGSTVAQNDPVVTVGRGTVFSQENVKQRSFAFTKNKNFKFSGNTTLSIWDQDKGSYNDDLLGSVKIGQTPTGWKSLSAGGYILRYRVTA